MRSSRMFRGDLRPSPAELLRDAAAWCEAHDVTWDAYGTGKALQAFEARVAQLLGYPAARFMPSGTMAQTVALRIWCERKGIRTFGMHPTSHVELHEERAYGHVHQLHATLVGPQDRPLVAKHLRAVTEPLGALLTELPIREAAGQLPTWEELQALKDLAAARNLPLHLDGARLWCCGVAYERPLHEITAGFSSCYVSFYKSVGALPGAMLLGPEDFIAEAHLWQRRLGGNLYSFAPNVATAALRLDAALASMPARLAGAKAIVAALADLPGLTPFPSPPHTHLFHMLIDRSPEQAYEARDRVAEELGIWLFRGVSPGPVPGTSRFEVSVGSATLSLEVAEIRQAFERFMAFG
ncbi:MAG: beta-eliminating lyase-related protein [Myxococcota bacterium]